ncbi:hypothetical protein BTH_I1156 [Burkholderia thailandensis E264]|uniref:Uncharacterized protein n=1 Tax=Burkholderia thailandensis (strain ATCC 700388 / DSM 13276 / CCUG 48851 / CIP 106301 / E264) TaxID=271848 RepID=Q2SZE6_BURTA|nr:hypothetical protein BTH_I1156 [Burkholderia thailandensis E264]
MRIRAHAFSFARHAPRHVSARRTRPLAPRPISA